MTGVFLTILNMSIAASIVALAVMLVRIPLKKAPKIFSYLLWAVVIFRLIFPFSIESIFSLMPTPANVIPQNIIYLQSPEAQIADTPVNVIVNNAMPVSETNLAVTAVEVVGYVWLIGFIVLLVYAAPGYISLKRRIGFATLVRDNIYETDRIKSPFVLGFIRPKIYFPTSIDPLRYDYILKHEQIHIKRRDYLIKPFAYIVFALHWFNPIMWIAYFLMSKDMELSCDEAVLRKTDEDIRKSYSMSLLCLSVKRVSLLSPIAFAVGESNVKERITNVLRFKKSANWVTVVSVILVGIFLIGFSSDRVLAAPIPAIINTQINSEQAEELGLSILNEHFLVFIDDWSNWDEAYFSLALHEDAIPRWFGQGGTGRNPSLAFNINDETGEVIMASYLPQFTYVDTSIYPFAIDIEDARYMSGGGSLPIEFLRDEYRAMLIEFSLGLFEGTGIAGNEVISADIIAIWEGFVTPFTIEVLIEYANGGYGLLYYWMSEESLRIAYMEINFPNL